MKCRILVVDDEKENIALLEECLSNDYELIKCLSGQDCLKMCKTYNPDIVLLDVVMSKPNGFDLCKKIKADEKIKNTRVVLLSSNSLIDDKLKGYTVGADDYLVKPVDHNELLMKIKVYTKLIIAEKHIIEMNESLKKQIQVQTQKLMQSEKMASIGQLAAGVAHEINNPMCFITTNLEALKDYLADLQHIDKAMNDILDNMPLNIKKNTQQQLDTVHEEYQYKNLFKDMNDIINESLDGAGRVTTIVNDLKTFARTDDRAEKVDINDALKKSLNVVWNQIKTNCTVKESYAEIAPVTGIETQLSQVFVNLLVNAGQAIEKEGEITITTTQQDNWVVVTISDNGCGIKEDDLNKIFDPFHTTKPLGVGTGLGLSISYAIIEKHGGRIEVDSKLGEGTTFRIQLDAKKEALAS